MCLRLFDSRAVDLGCSARLDEVGCEGSEHVGAYGWGFDGQSRRDDCVPDHAAINKDASRRLILCVS